MADSKVQHSTLPEGTGAARLHLALEVIKRTLGCNLGAVGGHRKNKTGANNQIYIF